MARLFKTAITSEGAITGTSVIKSGGTSSQFLKADGSTDGNTYLPTTSSYFAGHNPEGRLMYNTYLTNDMANARLRGSAVAATQNGVSYSISNANWDAMFDGTATFFNISPTSGFTFPLVITVPLPRTLTYGAWVGLSFGSTTFRANSVTIEVFSLDSSSWVTIFTTTSNTSEDIFAAVSGLTNSNATGINQVRYTIAAPNSTQLRLQHLWAYNFNSDMWSQTMMPRAGGTIYGAITVPDRITLKAVANAANQSNGLLLSNAVDAWQSGMYLKTDGSGNPRLTLLAPTGGLGEAISIDSAAKVGFNNIAPTGQVDITTAATTRVPLIIRPQASQTADMFQVRNATNDANLLRIDSGGNLKASNIATLNSVGQMAESNSGALFVMGRATAQASSPGLNTGTLYFRDGTTAGTLRLATRTGASGVEETIVDNLSSTGSTAGAQFVGAGGVNTSGSITANQVLSTNNGNGTNFKVGDDVWLGDINVSNTMSLKGQQSSTSGYIRFGGDSNAFGYDGTKLSYAGNLATSGLTLSSTTSPIILNASAGTSGQVLTSAGAGATPTWTTVSGGGSFTGGTLTSNLTLAAGTTSLSPLTFQSGTNLTTVTAGANEYDGTVFYQTSSTTPGRALSTQSYYYIHNATYGIDYSGSGAAQSILGGSTTGITLAAGTTYEFELNVAVQQQYQISNNFTLTHNWQSTTVTGSPVVSYIQIADYGSNTTGFTTAQTNSTVRVTTGGIIVSAAISTGSRYSIYNIRGTIRVTGTGTVKVYPTLAGTAATDNIVTIQAGSRLRLTPIGNGTVTTVGTWA